MISKPRTSRRKPRTESRCSAGGSAARAAARVLFFHGNAGNAGDRLDRARILHDRFGLDVFLVDYRGYGRSEGVALRGRALPRRARVYRRRAGPRISRRADRDLRRVARIGGGRRASRGASPAPASSSRRRSSRFAAMARVHYPFVPGFLIRSVSTTARDRARSRAQALPHRRAGRDRAARTGSQPLRARAAAEDPLRHPRRRSQRHVRDRRRAVLEGESAGSVPRVLDCA